MRLFHRSELLGHRSPSVQLIPTLEPANEKTKKLCTTSERLESFDNLNVLSFQLHSSPWDLTVNVILSDRFSADISIPYDKKGEGEDGRLERQPVHHRRGYGGRIPPSEIALVHTWRHGVSATQLIYAYERWGPSLNEASSVPASIQRQTPSESTPPLSHSTFPPQFSPPASEFEAGLQPALIGESIYFASKFRTPGRATKYTGPSVPPPLHHSVAG